jgi:nitrate reductase beta subunit
MRAGEQSMRGRVNLLNWDGNGAPPGLFPARSTGDSDTAGGSSP